MLYLNMRVTQPMIGMHTRLGQLEAHYIPAQLHTEGRQARSNAGWTQPQLEIDSYESRHAYGNTDNADFAREHGQQGLSDLARTTSKHTEAAWHNITQAARPGSDEPAAIYDRQLAETVSRQRQITTTLIPSPKIHVTPGQVTGKADEGDVTVKADTQAFASTHFTPGQVETYLQQKADVRRWTTEGRYDIYA
jgi:hypothetical protein